MDRAPNEPIDQGSLEHAADLISQADALIVAAGAGIGVGSGLPDFRGKEGFRQAYPALGREQVDFYRIACPEAFRAQPARAWGFWPLPGQSGNGNDDCSKWGWRL